MKRHAGAFDGMDGFGICHDVAQAVRRPLRGNEPLSHSSPFTLPESQS
jgi:hypothetical protein